MAGKLRRFTETFQEIKKLPGNIRQRIKTAIRKLADNPRPSHSKKLNLLDFDQFLIPGDRPLID
jgi:mRNA interferase RelE/StbE